MRTLLRLLVGVSALSWWVVPGMGLADLRVTWDADWAVVLEAGWGLLCTVGLGVPLLVAAIRPTLARAAGVQLLVLTVALALAAVGGAEPQMWWFFALLVVQIVLLHLLGRGPESRRLHPQRRLLVLAALAAPAGLAYSWSMLEENRAFHLDGDITVGVDHYAVQAAFGLAVVGLVAVAGLGLPGSRLLTTSAATMAGYLGVVSYAWVDMQADVGDGWSLAVIAWSVAVLLAAWWPSGAVVAAEPGRA